MYKLNYSNKSTLRLKCFLANFLRYKKREFFALPLALILSLFFLSTAQAACKGVGCSCQPSVIEFASPELNADEDGQYPIILDADNMDTQGDASVALSGDAQVSQGRRTIIADDLKYYRDSERVVAKGNIEMISENGHYLAGDSIDVVVPTQIGELKNVEFKLAENLIRSKGIDTVQIAGRGSAAEVNLEGEGVLSLTDARFTACPEGNDSVVITAGKMQLDKLAGVGTARNAVLRFQGLPILYSPYLSFPLNDERKTGFLSLELGSDEESGEIIELPWYWNIAKNQDATITPRYFSNRGAQLAVEYRHKSLNSNTFIYGEYLPDDDSFNGQDRDLISVLHNQQITDNLRLNINYNDVSDADYFEDLRNDVRYFSATFVPRDVSLNYNHRYFNLRARASEYQIIDPDVSIANQPYERLPSVSFKSRFSKGPFGMRYGVDASYTNFSLDSAGTRPEGGRFALSPYVSLPMQKIWGYVTPKISLHARQYNLDNVQNGDDNPSFAVPVFSVDSGLYFEKNTHWFGEAALQTLEPRVFYVYAPEEDQSDIPRFDTGQLSLNNFNQIFKELRFFGFDRVGDTNQVTLGVTSRIIDNETGRERLKASIGQLVLLDDLEQNLNGSVIDSGLSDLFAEFQTRSKYNWTTSGFMRYSHEESELQSASFSVGYNQYDDARKKVNVGYYFSAGNNRDTQQLSLSANWPINDKWSFFGAQRYDIEDSESLSTTIGAEYDSCCWKVSIAGQQSINDRNINDKIWSIFLRLELTSLGGFDAGL